MPKACISLTPFTTLCLVFLLSLFFSTGISSLDRNILPSSPISSGIISIILHIQKRSFWGCLLALRTTVTFTCNPRANSTVMFNHLGGKEFLVLLNLKAMLQLIKISPLAFTKATEMRKKSNKPEMGISFCLESIPIHHPLNPSQMVLNTEFLFSLPEGNNPPSYRKILSFMFVKVSAAIVTRKLNQALPKKSKVKCKTEHKLH